jgi:hypothetical protein
MFPDLHLVHPVVSNRGLADEKHKAGLVRRGKFAQGAHEWFVVLHATCRVCEETLDSF